MKKIELYRQHDEKDCGAACLLMILAYYNCKILLSSAKQAIKVDQDGSNIYGLIEGARQYGMNADAYGGSAEEAWKALKKEEFSYPLIIRILNDNQYEHFVVVSGQSGDKISILDPAKGKRKMSQNKFYQVFLGQIIELIPSASFVPRNERKGIYKRYFDMIGEQKGLLVATALISLFIIAIGMSGMYLFRFTIDSILSNLTFGEKLDENVEVLCLLIFGAGVLYFFKFFLTVSRSRMLASLSKKIDLPLMLGYYEHVTKLPLSYLDILKTGEIMSRFEDASKIRDAISGSIITVILDSFMVLICGLSLYLQSKSLFFAAFNIFIFYFVIAVLFIRPIKKANQEAMIQNAEFTSYLKESIDGLETVKATASENMICNRTKAIYQKLVEKGIRSGIVNIQKEALVELVTSIGNLSILWIGTMQVIEGNITVGTLVTFVSLLSYFLDPVQNLAELQGNIQAAIVAADRLNDIMNIEKEKKTGISFEKGVEKIDFNHVDFRYGNRTLVLRDFTFSVDKGQRIALVGESGCGKSTAAKMIMGLYFSEKGKVKINDIEIQELSSLFLRKQIAYVPQTTFLFSDTIRNNLLLGKDETNLSQDYIEKVLDICQCQFIKKMAFGIDSVLEENGSNLSGGQKQRIAIARALLGKPSVLILDESTSALDAVSEYKILEEIGKNFPDLIMITVTHRIQSTTNYDRIYVIENGTVIADGTHNELLTGNTVYVDLWNVMKKYHQATA